MLDAADVKVEELIDAAASPGLTFGTRLLLVLNGHKWNAKARQQIVAYLKDPMPDTCLAVEAETIAASDALHKAVAKLGGVLDWNLPKKYEMARWVHEQAKGRHLVMSTDVARTSSTAAATTRAARSASTGRSRSCPSTAAAVRRPGPTSTRSAPPTTTR